MDALCRLVDANFDLRRELFGDDTVGRHAIRMVDTARAHGFAAKARGATGRRVRAGQALLTPRPVYVLARSSRAAGVPS